MEQFVVKLKKLQDISANKTRIFLSYFFGNIFFLLSFDLLYLTKSKELNILCSSVMSATVKSAWGCSSLTGLTKSSRRRRSSTECSFLTYTVMNPDSFPPTTSLFMHSFWFILNFLFFFGYSVYVDLDKQ